MKQIGLLLFFLTVFLPANAQIHELGVFLGGSNTMGDIGSTSPVNTNSVAYGLTYKWNITRRYAIRAGLIASELKSYDFYAQDLSRFNRFIQIDNQVIEFSAGFEVNFFDFNLHDDEKEFSPYLFAGVGYFQHELFSIEETSGLPLVNKYDSEMNFAIPVVAGIKASLSPLFVLSLETGIRFTLSDNIDGSNPIVEYAGNMTLQHGNLYNNDWYVFTGFTLSYTFGQIPCYCKEK